MINAYTLVIFGVVLGWCTYNDMINCLCWFKDKITELIKDFKD